MEIVIAAVVVALGLAAGLVLAASLLARRAPALAGPRRAGTAPSVAAEPIAGGSIDADLKERRGEMVRLEERLLAKEAALDGQRSTLDRREEEFEEPAGRDRSRQHELHVLELERVSGLSASQAKSILLRELEDRPATSARAACARSRRRPSATPSAASATSSRSSCGGSPPDTPPRPPSRSSSSPPTT